MKCLIILVIGCLLSVNLLSQGTDSLLVSKINDITLEIDNNPDYLRLHEDGELTKKRLLFFEESVGGFYSNIVYKDSFILSTENEYYYEKNNRTRNEKFYFADNKLIKYIETEYEKGILKYIVEVYYKDQHVIKVKEKKYGGFSLNTEKKNSILEKSKKEISLRQMTTSEWKRIFGEY